MSRKDRAVSRGSSAYRAGLNRGIQGLGAHAAHAEDAESNVLRVSNTANGFHPAASILQSVGTHASSSKVKSRPLPTPPGAREDSDQGAVYPANGPILSDGLPVQQPGVSQSINPAAPLDQATEFWEAYNRAGDIEDKEFVRSSGGDLDVLLIFAGLFSAVDTAFIIEAYKTLKPDPVDQATSLLRSILLCLHNSTCIDEDPTSSFTVDPRDIRINMFFFASLCCSLSAAFGAVLAKQWLTQYDQDGGGSLKTPAVRGRERHQKYEGRAQWHIEEVITTLPTLLQFSLFLFFIGLADFICLFNTHVASVIMTFTSATFLFYTITISISVIDRSSPYQTPLSTVLARASRLPGSSWRYLASSVREFYESMLDDEPVWSWPFIAIVYLVVFGGPKLFRWVTTVSNRQYLSLTTRSEGGKRWSVESRCVGYLLERMTVPKDLEMLAGAIELLLDDIGLYTVAKIFSIFHLKPTETGGVLRFQGLHGQSLGAIVKMLGCILRKWGNPEVDQPADHPASSATNRVLHSSLTMALWDAFLAHPEDLPVYDTTRQIFLTLSNGENDPTSGGFGYNFPTRNGVTEGLMKSEDAVVQERVLRLVCLLPSIGRGLSDTMNVLRATASESSQLVDILQSTMWEGPNHQPDLEIFWLATFRVEVLSAKRLDTLMDSCFSEYLFRWFDHFALPNWQEMFPDESSFRHKQTKQQQLSLYWTYLTCLYRLLKHSNARTWAQELTRHGHISCLRVVLAGYAHSHSAYAEPLGLWLLLCLWTNAEAESGTNARLFFTRDCVRAVVRLIDIPRQHWLAQMVGWSKHISGSATIWTSPTQAAKDMENLSGWLHSYLNAATRNGLMSADRMNSVLQNYPRWCEELRLLLPTEFSLAQSEELHVMLQGGPLHS